jgi:hypothetical protein
MLGARRAFHRRGARRALPERVGGLLLLAPHMQHELLPPLQPHHRLKVSLRTLGRRLGR